MYPDVDFVDLRCRLRAFHLANEYHQGAISHLEKALHRLDASRVRDLGALDALSAGIELARRRSTKAARNLDRATFRLTGGRPLFEVFWSLPDDI